MEQQRHIDYLDYLRVFAALSVVWMHTAADGLRCGVTRGWHLMNLVTSLAFTAVPLFLMISGYLLLSDARTLRTDLLLRHRIPRLLLPLVGWTLVSALWSCLRWGMPFGDFLRLFVGGLYNPILVPYWFIFALLAIYLVSPLLRGGLSALDRSGVRLVLIMIGLVSLRAMIVPFLPDHWQHSPGAAICCCSSSAGTSATWSGGSTTGC